MGAASREIWLAPMTDPKALLSSDKLANFGLIGRRIILHPAPINLLKVEGETISIHSPPIHLLRQYQKTWLDEQLYIEIGLLFPLSKLQSHSISLQAFCSLCRSTLQALHSTHRTVKRSKLQRTEKVQTAEALQVFYSLLQD